MSSYVVKNHHTKKSKLPDKAVLIGFGILAAWVSFGTYLFMLDPFSYEWSRGEIGDFLKGLGGIALVIIGPTAWWQYIQLKDLKKQSYEEGVFRTFETLKPELENISVRVVGKAVKSHSTKSKLLENTSFNEMRQRYWDVDRTIFLRTMQKDHFKAFMEECVKNNNQELIEALRRYRQMMHFLDDYVENSEISDSEFKGALQATEVFVTYKSLQKSSLLSAAMQ